VSAFWDGPGIDPDRIGIFVPVNLQPKTWADEVVTNMVLEAQVLTRASQHAERSATLRAVGRGSP